MRRFCRKAAFAKLLKEASERATVNILSEFRTMLEAWWRWLVWKNNLILNILIIYFNHVFLFKLLKGIFFLV